MHFTWCRLSSSDQITRYSTFCFVCSCNVSEHDRSIYCFVAGCLKAKVWNIGKYRYLRTLWREDWNHISQVICWMLGGLQQIISLAQLDDWKQMETAVRARRCSDSLPCFSSRCSATRMLAEASYLTNRESSCCRSMSKRANNVNYWRHIVNAEATAEFEDCSDGSIT